MTPVPARSSWSGAGIAGVACARALADGRSARCGARPRPPDRRADGQPNHRRSPGRHRRVVFDRVRPALRGGGRRLARARPGPPLDRHLRGAQGRRSDRPRPDRCAGARPRVCDPWSRTSPTVWTSTSGRTVSERRRHDGGAAGGRRPGRGGRAGHARPAGPPAAARRLAPTSGQRSSADFEPVLALTATSSRPVPGTSTARSSQRRPVLDWVADDGSRRGDGAPVLVPTRRASSPPLTCRDPAGQSRS